MSYLVVGVSSSDRCYCSSLRCYQVPGGVLAVPHFCCFVASKILELSATLDFCFSVRRLAFLIHVFIIPTICWYVNQFVVQQIDGNSVTLKLLI